MLSNSICGPLALSAAKALVNLKPFVDEDNDEVEAAACITKPKPTSGVKHPEYRVPKHKPVVNKIDMKHAHIL